MKYSIESMDNGWVVRDETHDFEEDEEVSRDKMVFEASDDDDKDFARVLTYIFEQFVRGYDKHRKDNIKITFNKKGHRYEDPTTSGAVTL